MFVSSSAPDSPTLTSSSFITTTLSSASSLSIIRSCSMILDDLNHLIFASTPPSTSLSPLYQHLNTTILSLLQKHLFSLNSALYKSPTPSLSSSALPFPSTSAENLLNEFHNEIVLVLTYFKRILNDLRKQRPNHFGIFEAKKYQYECMTLSNFCESILKVDFDHDPYALLSPSATKHSPAVRSIRDVSARLFWLDCFGSLAAVPWKEFFQAFSQRYELEEMHLRLRSTFYQQLLNPQPLSSQRSKENKISINPIQDQYFDALITVQMLDHFTALTAHPEYCGLYQSFQFYCDPSTMVMVSGMIDDSTEELTTSPTVIHSLLGHHIVQISCGGQHAAVLTSLGEIYSWGRGGFGRLGHGNLDVQKTPKMIQALAQIPCKQIACGFAYSAAVDLDGRVYTWGAGENGRLGLGTTFDRVTPVLVSAIQHIVIDFVAAGSVHTCLKSNLGHIYTCGKFEYTGHGSTSDILIPTILDCFEQVPIKEITVGPGGYHTIVLTVQDQVYSWGHNRVGQLGYSINNNMSKNHEGAYFLPTPQPVPLPHFAEHYSLIGRQDIVENCNESDMNISHSPPPHSFAASADPAASPPPLQRSLSSSLQSMIQIKHVIAGWGHSCLITTDGIGYVCGRNQHGQLGLGEPRNFPLNERNHHYQPYFIPILSLIHSRLSHVSCGGEHTVFCTEKNEVYSTGRGHKGQLGHQDKADCNVPTKISFFNETLHKEIDQIACGNSSTLYLIGKYCQPLSLVEQCIEELNHCYEEYQTRTETGAGVSDGQQGGAAGGVGEEGKMQLVDEMLNMNTAMLRNILPPHQSQLLREWKRNDQKKDNQ